MSVAYKKDIYKTIYKTEREGQIAFFDNYGIDYSAIIDNTDGVYNGNLLEFKLNITNLNKVLFQAIKYLSKMRIKGESVPATILLIDLNNTKVYLYKSQDYFEYIHKIYIGAASKNNDNFIANEYNACFDYSLMVDSDKVKHILKDKKTDSEKYIPIEIDENCIIGWAKRYYEENPTASKGDFIGDDNGKQVKIIGEIRNPKQFRNLILPYTKRTNEKFRYLMDCLNDRLSKKDLGAFYTPMPYAKKAAELIKQAVDRVPDGNDYIILDRCAGTGNLEVALIDLKDKNGDDLISHCIVATYEYYEYKVLSERIGDIVRHIIPPTEGDVNYESGKIRNADALSKEFLDNKIIKQYIDNPKCTVILFENPPYSESGAINYITDDNYKQVSWKKSYIHGEYSKEINGISRNEMANMFIWSGFKYYLKEYTDSYILFSPIKYWKSQHMMNKHFLNGFIFNRKHFHASQAAIACISWGGGNVVKI